MTTDRLTTEGRNPRTMEIDILSVSGATPNSISLRISPELTNQGSGYQRIARTFCGRKGACGQNKR